MKPIIIRQERKNYTLIKTNLINLINPINSINPTKMQPKDWKSQLKPIKAKKIKSKLLDLSSKIITYYNML